MAAAAIGIPLSFIGGYGSLAGGILGTLGGIVGGVLDNQFIFPALFAEDPVAPSIGAFEVNYAEEGSPVSYVFGANTRVHGNILFASLPFPNTRGGGGKRGEPASVTWYADVVVAGAWGTTQEVERVDMDGQVVYRRPQTITAGLGGFGQLQVASSINPQFTNIDVSFDPTKIRSNIHSVQNWSEQTTANWQLDNWYMTIQGRDGFDTTSLAQFIEGERIRVNHSYELGFQTGVINETMDIVPGFHDFRPVVVESFIVSVDPLTGFQKGRLVLDLQQWIDGGWRDPTTGEYPPQPKSALATFGTGGAVPGTPPYWAGPVLSQEIPYLTSGLIQLPIPVPAGSIGWPHPMPFHHPWPANPPSAGFPRTAGYDFQQTTKGWRDDLVDQANTSFFQGTSTQAKSSLIEKWVGTESTPGLPFVSYAEFAKLNLSMWGNRIPQVTFHYDAAADGTTTQAETYHLLLSQMGGIPDVFTDVGWVDDGQRNPTRLTTQMEGVSFQALDQPARPAANMMVAYDHVMAEYGGAVRVIEAENRDIVEVDHAHLDARPVGSPPSRPLDFEDDDPMRSPQRVHVRYVSVDKSLQFGSESDSFDGLADLQGGIDRTTRQIDLGNVALPAFKAKQIARRINRDQANRERRVKLRLPGRYLHVTPGDIISLDADGSPSGLSYLDQDWYVQVDRVDLGDDFLVHIEGLVLLELPTAPIAEEPDFASAPLYPVETGGVVKESGSAVTVTVVLDVTPFQDSDTSELGVYVAYGLPSNFGGNPGGYTLWERVGGGGDFVEVPGQAMTSPVGYTLDALGGTRTDIVDWTHTVDVVVYGRNELESITREQLLNWQNRCVIGKEVLQFQTATLIGTSTYRLSGLLRGRLGTVDQVETHHAGDPFVLITPALRFHPMDNAVAGTTRAYRVATGAQQRNGRVADYAEINIAGNSNRSLPPVHFTYYRNASGDVVMSWVRQSRVSFRHFTPDATPLAEVTEVYDIVIDPDGVAREQTGLTSPTDTYTIANQGTDSLTGLEFDIDIHQFDAVRGRGRALRAHVQREFGQLLDENGTDTLTAEDDRTLGTEN